ncbi:ligase-associated DNA damage response endonuclease PdeM [Pseudohoeflea coraliihabitans]|uniref:Ligase-associated DNA damage response endonuclease PdeM n=1 Tax=Pseudohoeflea coraliihabitans TaxID=2860393 RepID=A0ABS6WNB4_9HYPH|nr:ligase-associated DNA damage response endonuclease PdeM [Pseudohoeflea sp. DP4N28-3]MBW3097456.1 ligase-associated DNA damage response endonuclease PdeM [Pseudohoeflea sp. DP4N28-3]
MRQSEIELNGTAAVCACEGVLYLPGSQLLAVSDLHLEKGAAFARRGLLLPPYDTAATLSRLNAAITRFQPKVVLSLGDSFHDRTGSAHLPDLYRTALQALQRGRDWIWIEGNHDPDPPVGLDGECCREFNVETLVFRHEPLPRATTSEATMAAGTAGAGTAGEVAGHLHPVARVVRRGKGVRRACFATDGKRMLMPAFGATTGGLLLEHPAIRPLFDPARLVAHLIGGQRIYSIPARRLAG